MDEQLNACEQGYIKHNEDVVNSGGDGFGSHGEARPAGRIERIKTWVSGHRRESLAIMGLVAVLLVLLGLTLGWFVDANRGSTVGKIKEPAELKVLGPNATATEQIDLSYNPEYGDTKTGNTVTLKRPFCVQTGGDGFELQLANTTNIEGLTIELYKAENTPALQTPDVIGTAGGRPYKWKASGTDLLASFTPINDAGDGLATVPVEGANDLTFKAYIQGLPKGPTQRASALPFQGVQQRRAQRQDARRLDWQRHAQLYHQAFVGRERQRDRCDLSDRA